MVKQGSIIRTNFDPTRGHEQSGFRPALVISDDIFTDLSNLTLVCPITNSIRNSSLRIALCEGLLTTGYVMIDQVRAVDLKSRRFTVVERVPKELALEVSEVLKGSIHIGNDYDEDEEEIEDIG
ncbi:MAG: type II toxin-antitoxin system PemK/MazF family toxin [Clostridiales bacterium]|jgi:mRNA interferase MazF|nr:type II toxin-antitoxin system PemK/MazF family toxin [Clostridiales bacterium]